MQTKIKSLNCLSSASYNYRQEIDKKDLYSATKIVKEFENPTTEYIILLQCRTRLSQDSLEIKDHFTNAYIKECFEKFEGKQISLPTKYAPNQLFLEKHRMQLH